MSAPPVTRGVNDLEVWSLGLSRERSETAAPRGGTGDDKRETDETFVLLVRPFVHPDAAAAFDLSDANAQRLSGLVVGL